MKKILFNLPPLEKRLKRNFLTSCLLLPDYTPLSHEAVLLLRSIILGNILNFFLIVIMPIIIWPNDFVGFKYNYPLFFFPFIIFLALIYLLVLASNFSDQHTWDFVTFQKRFLKNIQKWSARGYGPTRVALYLFLASTGMLIIMALLPYAIDAFLSYNFVKSTFWFVIFDSWFGLIITYTSIFLLFSGATLYGFLNFLQLVAGKHPYQNILD